MGSEANSFLAGAAWSDFRGYVCHPQAAGRHRWAALVARELVGFWLRLQGAEFLCTSADVRGVLSHSRERTKGRPVAAKSRQHHGCPRTPRRLGCGRNLLLREAIGFLAGAAWSGFRCHACCPLAAGRHRWAALAVRGLVGLSGVTWLAGWCGGADQERCGSLYWYMAGGAGVASVGLRRRSPPLSPKAERASMGEAGRP